MTSLDLDSFRPDYHLPLRKPRTRKEKMMARACYVYTYSDGYSSRRVGVRPEKMLDWRRIEKRYAELQSQQKSAWDLFWNTMHELRKGHVRDEETELWVGLDKRNENLFCISETGYSHSFSETELKRVMQSPTKYKYVFLSFEECGVDLAKLEARYKRLLRVADVYKNAFHRAAGDRIYKFSETMKTHGSSWCPPFAVIVQNEGRRYVASVENLTLRWHLGEIYTS